MNLLKYLFGPKWLYGQCNNLNARKNVRKGNVQFLLWKAGQHGHKKDYWINFDSSWWKEFKTK